LNPSKPSETFCSTDPACEIERQKILELGKMKFKEKKKVKSQLAYNNIRMKTMNIRTMNGRH